MPSELLLGGPRILVLNEYRDAPLKVGEVRAAALLSGVSHGTELIQYRGDAASHRMKFDHDSRIFLKEPPERPYPRSMGYEWVGRVRETGPGVTRFAIDDLVHLPYGHRETQTFHEATETPFGPVAPLPPGMAPEAAVFHSLAGVALLIVHDSRAKIGDRVAVFGLGAIGLLTIQLLRLAGVGWIDAVDPMNARRDWAARLGADRTLDPGSTDVGQAIKSSGARRGADTAIEISGSYAALHEAIRSVRVGGLVVAGGYYQGGAAELRLGEEWHHNRVTMVSSMGSHQCTHRDHPLWDRARVTETAADLLASGRLKTEGMISRRYSLADAARAYEALDGGEEAAIKIALTYSSSIPANAPG